MPRRNFFALALIAAVSIFCWHSSQGAKPRDEMMEMYGLFVDAVEKVEANYVKPVSRRDLLESALEGMLQNLDPHSAYINVRGWRQFRRQIEGRFGGIGIQIEIDADTGRLKVIAPMVGTPAYDAGILAGDLIVEIDGQSTEGMSSERAVEVLTGRPGTEVKLGVIHDGAEEPETIAITRAIIDVPSVVGDRRKPDDQYDFMFDHDKKIGYIRITGFMQNTTEELKDALDELKDESAKGLIIDLRDNPGGLLSAAVEVSDLFLDKGEIVSTKGRNTLPKKFEATPGGAYTDLPLVLLVNQNSASASEIVAAALQDHKRAKIIGQRTFGKGSVQNILDLEGGNSVLKLTVASYYRPCGENIHRFRDSKPTDKWGVSPDAGLEVKLTPQAYRRWWVARQHRDQESAAKGHRKTPAPQTKAADAKTAAPSEKSATSKQQPSEKSNAKEAAKGKSERSLALPFVDKQLDKALEVIRAELEPKAKAKAA
jgi:carboxyl-terminal processing protease